MFTGIVDHQGHIQKIHNPTSNSLTLWVQHEFTNLQLGESIALDGICLTVNAIQNQIFTVNISPETYELTTAKLFKLHQKINLERALTLNDHLGGHIILGHVDKTAQIQKISKDKDFTLMQIGEFQKTDFPLLVTKGSIAINGVSLTINKVLSGSIEIMLIPHTLARTNLQLLKIHDTVNIEFDYFARLIQKQLQLYLEESRHEN